jgi:hypothetical protein
MFYLENFTTQRKSTGLKLCLIFVYINVLTIPAAMNIYQVTPELVGGSASRSSQKWPDIAVRV